MDTKYILIAIFLLVVFLQMRNKETFSAGLLNLKTKEQNCANTTAILNDVNKFEKQSCKEDDSKPNNQVANNRLTCRDFEERNIFLSRDRNSHCKGLKNKPKLLKFNKVGDFKGINQLELNNSTPAPIEDFDMDESNFPFEMNMVDTDFLNLDNKSD
jgi:hypothetical protein